MPQITGSSALVHHLSFCDPVTARLVVESPEGMWMCFPSGYEATLTEDNALVIHKAANSIGDAAAIFAPGQWRAIVRKPVIEMEKVPDVNT